MSTRVSRKDEGSSNGLIEKLWTEKITAIINNFGELEDRY